MSKAVDKKISQEKLRLKEDRERRAYWKRWGPYLSERQWGTVREDYSPGGTAWDYSPHDHARSRAYRWGEDGIMGISDNHQRLCFALALWNSKDSILKERLFGLTGTEGNHGEDVKEYYYYLDSTPTHAYMKALYKYPQAAFPYADLVAENKRRSRRDPEYELIDTGVFKGDRYFDVQMEYAKNATDDILIQVTAFNRGPNAAALDLLPTLWFRNTWSWRKNASKPKLSLVASGVVRADHPSLGRRWLYAEKPEDALFTENETNFERLWQQPNPSPFVKDGINNFIVNGKKEAVNPKKFGTKSSFLYRFNIPAGSVKIIRLRLTDKEIKGNPFSAEFERVFKLRKREADEFYTDLAPANLTEDEARIQRQAFAGMLWSKQFYNYVVADWLRGDPTGPTPPPERLNGRNRAWEHFYSEDILSMPDKWEYPWFAAWDLAFHTIPLAMVDSDFAKRQLELFTREWYMHPNGQIPAYEWAFGDVNPPVHAWAAWRVYKIDKKMNGRADRGFLERVFQKLLLNFTWWVNRKDAEGRNIFQGGFLGLDNIGVFDRGSELPTGGRLEQSDGTSWMAMYCLNMLAIAFELAKENKAYEDIASKFFEHFLYIAEAMNNRGHNHLEEGGLWDEEDGFFYDVLHMPDGRRQPLTIRSMVGLIPLFAVETLEGETLKSLSGFRRRYEWFMENRPDLQENVASLNTCGINQRRLLAVVDPDKLKRILSRMLDESEFLSPYGIRALSRYHKDHPFAFRVDGDQHSVDYEPAESTSGFFGGNSNWRGPVWFPMNFLLIEALQKFHHYLGDGFKVECPIGSGIFLNLWQVAEELSSRLIRIFKEDYRGRRPVFSEVDTFQADPHWDNYLWFYEYFHADTGAGVGASHQTGWTGLVAKLIQQQGEWRKEGERLDKRNTLIDASV